MDWITSSTTLLVSSLSTILTTITDTPVLALIFTGTTILPICFKVYHSFKRN